jgi:hypothetical protein
MRERHLVKDLAAMQDGPVVLGGWVEKLRDQKTHSVHNSQG